MTRTPEERLLSKRRLGSFYLADVRALIERAETAEARVAELEAALTQIVRQYDFDEEGDVQAYMLADRARKALAGDGGGA